jgi:tetratricopeptide (TPR) repeat protein
VGGLSQEEEVAEIEEDAILVEASDEAIEVAPEPESEPLAEELVPQEVVSLESDQGESIEPLAADDEALEAAAQEAVSDGQEIYAELAGDEELIAASPEGDELALSTAESSLQVSEPLEETPFGPDPGAEVGEELEGEATMAVVDPEDFSAIEPEMENLGEPLEGPGTEDGEVELQPTLPGKVSIEAARPPPGSDVYEEATRVAHLPSLLIQAATPKTDPGSISQATTLQGAQQPIDEFEDEPTTILPRLDSTAPSELPPSPKTLPGARDARELLAQVQAVAPEPQAPVAEQSQVSEAEAQEEPALDELEEAAFFIDQQMYDEAREIIETVILSYPTSLRAKELLARLELVEAGGAAAPVATPEQSGVSQLQAATTDGAFDLASELAKEDIGGPGEVSAAQPGEDFQYSVEDVFDEFKKGLRKVVKPEDVDTHYDLGIAYKEMGLLEDAIGEFEQAAAAAAGKKKEIESLAMVGLCRIERSEWNEAVEAFQRALALPQVTPETAKAVRFELAQALEKMGRGGEALHHYEKVQKADPDFRDVGSAVERLIESGAEEEHTEPTGRSLKGPSNGSSARADAKPDVATGPEEPSPKGPNDPKGKKARKIGYV